MQYENLKEKTILSSMIILLVSGCQSTNYDNIIHEKDRTINNHKYTIEIQENKIAEQLDLIKELQKKINEKDKKVNDEILKKELFEKSIEITNEYNLEKYFNINWDAYFSDEHFEEELKINYSKDKIQLEKLFNIYNNDLFLNDETIQNRLFIMFYHGIGTITNKEKALNVLRKSANIQKNSFSQMFLVVILSESFTKPLNYESYKFLKKSAENGNHDAQYNLGQAYRLGNYVEKNTNNSNYWYELAAKNGNGYAALNLGAYYQNKKNGSKEEHKKAFELYKIAMKKNIADGYYNVGQMYMSGQGVEKDTTKAIKYFEKAANLGSNFSAFYLGSLYQSIDFVDKDLNKSFKWHEKAAFLNNKASQFMVFSFYYNRLTVKEDNAKAYAWLRIASENKNDTFLDYSSNRQIEILIEKANLEIKKHLRDSDIIDSDIYYNYIKTRIK